MTQVIIQTNLDELLADCGTIDAVSWQAPRNMSYAQWAEIGGKFQHISGSINWWLGDWLNEGEKRYGEKYAQAVEVTGHKLDHLQACGWVAGSVRCTTRIVQVSWTHHRYVAHLPDTEQRMWLEHVEAHGLSSRELKAALEQANANRKPLPQPDLNWMPEATAPTLPLPQTYTNGAQADDVPYSRDSIHYKDYDAQTPAGDNYVLPDAYDGDAYIAVPRNPVHAAQILRQQFDAGELATLVAELVR